MDIIKYITESYADSSKLLKNFIKGLYLIICILYFFAMIVILSGGYIYDYDTAYYHGYEFFTCSTYILNILLVLLIFIELTGLKYYKDEDKQSNR